MRKQLSTCSMSSQGQFSHSLYQASSTDMFGVNPPAHCSQRGFYAQSAKSYASAKAGLTCSAIPTRSLWAAHCERHSFDHVVASPARVVHSRKVVDQHIDFIGMGIEELERATRWRWAT